MNPPVLNTVAPAAATPPRAAIPGINATPGEGLPPTQYDELFAQTDRDNGLPAGMTKMVAWKESRFNPNAVSPAGAQGITQFMPDTAKRFNIDPLDPKQAIPATGKYLRQNYDKFGDWSHALASYNWGEGNVQRMLAGANITPPAETKDYVQTIIGKLGALPQNAQAAPVDNALSKRSADIGVSRDGTLYVNGETFDSKDYGKAIELYRSGAFTAPGQGKLPAGFKAPKPGDVETYFQSIVPSSDSMKAIKAGGANYKAGWNELLGAGYQIAGRSPDDNPGMQAADINKRYAEQLGATSSLPQTWDSAQGVGGVSQLTYGKFLESLPYMVEAISTGLVGAGVKMAATRGAVAAAQIAAKAAGERALMSGVGEAAAQAAAQAAAKDTFKSTVPFALRNAPDIAMLLGTTPSSAGDILGNQREQAGEYAPGAAAALAPLYAGLNLLGVGPQALRSITGDAVHGAVSGLGGVSGRVVRGAGSALMTGVEQGAQEAGQEVVNQAGLVVVDPSASMTSDDALARYKESAILGGLIGVPGGALAGVSARARAGKRVDLLNQTQPPMGMAPSTDSGSAALQEVTASAAPATQVSPNIAPAGNIDLRGADAGSRWSGVRTPLVDNPAQMANTTGTAQEPVTATLPQQVAEPQPATPGAPALIPGGVPSQTNMLGEQYTPAAPAVAAGNPQAGVATEIPEGAVTAGARGATTSVTRQAPPRYKLRAAEEAAGAALPATGAVVDDTVMAPLPKTRGEQLKARAAENAAGMVEMIPGNKRPKGSKGTVVATATKRRQSAVSADDTKPIQETVQGAQHGLDFKGAFKAAAGAISDNFYTKAFAALQAGKDTIAGVKDPVLTRAKAAFDAGRIKSADDLRAHEEGTLDTPIDDEDAKKIGALFAVSRRERERAKEPSGREQRKASADTVGLKKLHEETQNNGELNEHLQRIEKLNRSLRGPDDYVSRSKNELKKPVGQRARAEGRSGLDRVASDARERATRIEAVLDHFDKLVKEHGVAKVNAMFDFRKKNKLETKPRLEGDENAKQSEANIRLSNLWRLYRQGSFDNAFGFTRGRENAMGRSRREEGSKPTTLMSWFKGEHSMIHKGGGPINGVKAIAYYMRIYGRSDLEGLLGGRLYHIFKGSRADVDLQVLEGKNFLLDGRGLDGAFITATAEKPVKVVEEGGREVTLTKPTIVVTKSTANEEIVPHELLHAATWHVISTDADARAKFAPIVDAMRKAKKEGLSPEIQQIVDTVTQKNDAVGVAELVAYGFSNWKFQDFLRTIEMSPPRQGRVAAAINNAFEFFVNMVKLVTGAHGAKYTALSRFIEEGARLLQKAEEKSGTGQEIVLGANSLFKGAAFRHRLSGQVVESGVMHDRNKLTKEQQKEPIGNWEAGFVDHNSKFYTRDQAHARLEGVGGDLHSSEVWDRNADGTAVLGHAAALPVEKRVAFGNILNPVHAIETVYKNVAKHVFPFLHAEVGEKSTFEKWVEKNAATLANKIIENHPRLARIAAGTIDKFGVPEKWQAIVDMGRKQVHNADQISFGWWENMRGFDESQQKLVHDYIAADGKMDASKFTDEQQVFLANLNTTLKNIVERAAEQGTLPEGLKTANPVELVRWINKDTARLAFGLKTSGNYTNWPKGYTASAYKGMVLGDAEGYHRGVADLPNADPAAPDYVYVPVGAKLAAKEKELGYKIKDLDQSKVWRVLKEKDTTKTMWSGISYAEGRSMMKATNFTDALVVTMHNLMHDTAANEWANNSVTGNAIDSKDSLVYADREALANDVGEEKILDDVSHSTRQLLARTPGYWVKLGSGYGDLSGKYVPATVYSIITDVRDKSPIFPEYRTVLNFWKKTKTAWSPATHFNNVASSFVMAYMNDIPVSTIAKAFQVFLNREDGGANAETWKDFTYSGALVSSFSAGEVGTSIARKINAVIAKEHHAESARSLVQLLHKIEQTKAVALLGKASEAAVEWYQHEDNIFRLAAFMEGARRGMNTEAAGKFAADSMINYSIDARYINNLRKTVMPFLAWPYRMVPMMLRTALFKPWKIATMITMLYGLNALSYAISGEDEDEERKKLPEYMRGSMFLMPGAPQALRMPGSVNGKPLYWNISSFMPLGNFAEEARNGFFGIQGWPQGLMPSGPLVTAAELFLNHDSFTGKPIFDETEGGAERAGDVLKAAWTAFSPNLPLPYNRQGDKVNDLLRNKHGITGGEMEWATTILSLVGPKLVPLDTTERGAQAGVATAAIVHEYRTAIHKMARDEMRYENPDFDKIHDKQASLVAKMLQKIRKAKGDD